MNRVIAFVVCGFTLSACSGSSIPGLSSIPGFDYFKSSPPKTANEAAGGRAKVAAQKRQNTPTPKPAEASAPEAIVAPEAAAATTPGYAEVK
jgi:hypothetical protein